MHTLPGAPEFITLLTGVCVSQSLVGVWEEVPISDNKSTGFAKFQFYGEK